MADSKKGAKGAGGAKGASAKGASAKGAKAGGAAGASKASVESPGAAGASKAPPQGGAAGGDFDLVVVGGGPGGYVAAIRAAQLGLRAAVVERRATLGGTCLNVGCIPSKALLSASERWREVSGGHLEGFGVAVEGARLDLAAMRRHKDKVVAANVKGIDFLLRKNGVERVLGEARLEGPGRVSVGGASLGARAVAWATGSEPTPLPGAPFDGARVVSSTEALEFDSVPPRLVVVGGGYIGLELGCVWSRLGSEVTVVEFQDRVLPGMDSEVAKKFQPILKSQGLRLRLGTKVESVEAGREGVRLSLAPAAGGPAEPLEADAVLVAVGRRPFSSGVEEAGVALDARGHVKIDEGFRTSVEGVFAIGDVAPGPMLAHKAEEEGVALAERLAGGAGLMHYDAIPGIVYTAPEAASVGATEDALKEQGVPYRVGTFPFSANGRARAMGAAEGFAKILAHAETDRLLGAHVLGPDAGGLIHEAAVAMAFGGAAEDLARVCHGHPTLNEVVKEAALAALGRAIHA